MMHGFYGGFGGPGFQQISWWWLAMGALRWVIIGIGVYLIFKAVMKNRGTGGSTEGSQEDSAQRILRERYARGEIDEVTFEKMKDKLKDPTRS